MPSWNRELAVFTILSPWPPHAKGFQVKLFSPESCSVVLTVGAVVRGVQAPVSRAVGVISLADST